MHLKRTPILAIVLGLVLLASVPSAPADHDANLKTEYLKFLGDGSAIANQPCDADGIGGVRFCETVAAFNETGPHRVLIDIRSDLGTRVGGYYEFQNAAGNRVSRGFFCGSVNTFVHPNAVQLRVWTDAIESAALCSLPPFVGVSGTVTAVWRYNAPVECFHTPCA